MKGVKPISICLIGFVFVFAIVQFFLILRHKSPYTSDTYFYKHLAYQLDGKSYQSSKELILKEASSLHDPISRNIFENEKLYDDVYVYFIKRPIYPVLIYLFGKITGNYFQALLIPVFLGYLGTIFAAYYLLTKRFGIFFATIGTCLFISFYPFLDLSTYFLTDPINSFFWLTFLILIYKYCVTKRKIFLRGYVLLLAISLFTREQSLLFPLVILLVMLLNRIYHTIQVSFTKVFVLSVFVSILYFIFSFTTKQRTLIDALFYTEASYGFREINRNYASLLTYMQKAIIASHLALIRDLASHHWWSTFSLVGILGAGYQFLVLKKPNLLDLLVLCSGVVSYLAIFLYPVLSYRYFYPAIFCVVYFSILLLKKINSNLIQNNLKTNNAAKLT